MKVSLHGPSAWLIASAVLGLLFSAAPASAQLAWTWSYKCSAPTKCLGGSGEFETTDRQGSGINEFYAVTYIGGVVEGNPITSLLPTNFLGGTNDNKIDNFGNPFSNSGHAITGIAFLTNDDAPTMANRNLLFSNFIDDFVGYYTQIGGPNNLALLNVDFSAKQVGVIGEPVPVPEPAGLLMFTIGLLSLGAIVGKKLPEKMRG